MPSKAPVTITATSAVKGKPVVLKYRDGNPAPISLFVDEATARLYIETLTYNAVLVPIDPITHRPIDIDERLRKNSIEVPSGTHARQLRRIRRVLKMGDTWWELAEVQVTSGSQTGKRGFVVTDYLVPDVTPANRL